MKTHKPYLTSFILFAIHTATQAATMVSGIIVEETWVKAKSPYNVVGHLLIANLTIEPGVEVVVEGFYVFEVAGRLTAVGTATELIQFRKSESNPSGWQGIYFNENPPGSSLVFCAIQDSIFSGIRVMNTQPVVRDCIIANNSNINGGGGIRWLGTPLTLVSCVVSNNSSSAFRGGGVFADGNTNFISSCVFVNNRIVAGNSDGGGLYLDRSSACTLVDCQFIGNRSTYRGGGIYGGQLDVRNSSFMGNSAPLDGSGVHGTKVWMRNCEVRYNSGASVVYAESQSAMLSSVLAGNQYGALLFAGSANGVTNCTIAFNNGYGISGSSTVSSSIIWGNNTEISGSSVVFSDVQGGYSGEGNIAFNPIFHSTTDLLLVPGSPCIDAGEPALVLNDACFPPSWGSERNDMGAYGGPGACNWPIAPIIVRQPRSWKTCVGREAMFTVEALGEEPIAFQWRKEGVDIPGATATEYLIQIAELEDAGVYSVVISNRFGQTISELASLTVDPVCVSIDVYAGLTIGGILGETYRVEYVGQLAVSNDWRFLTNVMQSESEVLWIDPEPARAARKFYRVVPAP